ncbi:MAG: hypothetical protein HQK96_04350 [Nitrospirae bacterium]|nr:hypothetical protein [Nitrospirota bacterium]
MKEENGNLITRAVKKNRSELITQHPEFDASKLKDYGCGIANALEFTACVGLRCTEDKCPFSCGEDVTVKSMRKWLKLDESTVQTSASCKELSKQQSVKRLTDEEIIAERAKFPIVEVSDNGRNWNKAYLILQCIGRCLATTQLVSFENGCCYSGFYAFWRPVQEKQYIPFTTHTEIDLSWKVKGSSNFELSWMLGTGGIVYGDPEDLVYITFKEAFGLKRSSDGIIWLPFGKESL